MTEDQLRHRAGYAATGHGELLPVGTGLRLADEAAVVGMVLDAAGGIVSYGTTRRLATPGQRSALAARDGDCSFPGCPKPPSWCQAHHVRAWQDGRATHLTNLTLSRVTDVPRHRPHR